MFLFRTYNGPRPSAPSNPSTPAGNPSGNSHNFPHQLILNGLAKWRAQVGLPALVLQQRDAASRQIERYLDDPSAIHIELRGMHLQGLPPEMAHLRTVLQERSTVNTPAELRLSPEAFNKQSDIKTYSNFLKEHIRVETAQAEHQLRCVTSLVNVTNAMREKTLPVFNDLIDTLQFVSNPENTTLQIIGDYFTTLATKVNKNIAKTTANNESVSTWPNVSFQSSTMNNLDRTFYVLQQLAILKTELQGAEVTRFHSADNVPKAQHRIGQLIELTAFVEKLFNTVDEVQSQKLELTNQIQQLEKSLSNLHQRCIDAELQGASSETEVTQLAKLLINQTEALRDAVKDIIAIQTSLNELAEQELPDDLQKQLPLIQKIKNWNTEYQPTLETLRLHRNVGLIMGRLSNPHQSAVLTAGLCEMLSEKIIKLPSNSKYWDLIEAHPLTAVRELAATRRQQMETQKIEVEELYPQVKTRHTNLTTRAQKEAAFEVARQGDLEALHACLSKGLDPEVRNDDQKTLLHIAAEHGQTDLITWLARTQQLSIEATCNKGRTPFLTAARAGQTLGMGALLDLGANVDAKDRYGCYAIHLAAEYGNRDTMQWLMNHGANVNAKCHGGKIAIHYAASSGSLDAVEFCINTLKYDLDAETQYCATTPLQHTAFSNRPGTFDTMRWLANQGARGDVKNIVGNLVIHYAAQWGSLDKVKFCVETLGLELDAKGQCDHTPLLNAARGGKIDTMQWLVDQGAKKDARASSGNMAIHFAAQSGNLDAVKFCVEKLKQSLEAQSRLSGTPLLHAAHCGDLKTVRWLISKGANKNAVDDKGRGIIELARGETKNYVQSLSKYRANFLKYTLKKS